MKTSIILVAAGRGERFGQEKVFCKLAGKTLLEWNLELFSKLSFDPEIVIVCAKSSQEKVNKICSSYQSIRQIKIVEGGEQRVDSVQRGLKESAGEIVLIHNLANPLADKEDFESVNEIVKKEDCACFVGQRAVDTLRRINVEEVATIDRSDVWRVQTPQGFRKSSLLELLKSSAHKDEVTDEVLLYELEHRSIRALQTAPQNQKITYPEDLQYLERFVSSEVLTGIGDDSHAFDTEGELVLAGVIIADQPKLKGNSDADVILHAIFNAISSALGEGSIAPTADPMCQSGITDSAAYLSVILDKMRARSFSLNNLSISLEGKRPKIEARSGDMKDHLSGLLSLDISKIGITATSGEKLSSFGRGEGIRCSVIVSLIKNL